jgi:hypothetical protein
MDNPTMAPDERFAAVVQAFVGDPEITPPSDEAHSRNRFGSNGLKIHNRIFAMLVNGKLVVKLPRQRVDALIASGEGERFDPGHGRVMKEWLTVEPGSKDWLPLAREAMEFVASRG